jgi:TPR repeat protein
MACRATKELALDWFRKAAEQGHAGAQDNLGLRYEHGQGVEQDHGIAAHWYRKAAEQGFAGAQYHLAS